MSKTKFYHCSPKRFRKGDVLISPSEDKDHNYPNSGHAGVFLNTSPVPHFTIWEKIVSGWYVYEVEPVGKLTYGMWNDIICQSAIVVKRIGNAKGILDKYKSQRKPCEYGNEVYVNEKAYVLRKRWKEIKKKW